MFHDTLLEHLQKAGIQATDQTPARKGNIALPCPYCGTNDTGKHLSIKTQNPAQGLSACWRDNSHNHHPNQITKLLKALNLSNHSIKTILQELTTLLPPKESLKEYTPLNLGWTTTLQPNPPKEWNTRHKQAIRYLKNRIQYHDYKNIITKYNLFLSRRHPGRIMIPITRDTEIINYQGRAINPDIHTRYLAADTETEGGISIKNTIFNEDSLSGNTNLVITEGVFDAISIETIHKNTHATATFGTTTTQAQKDILNNKALLYEKIFVAGDNKAEHQAIQTAQELNAELLPIPEQDPEGIEYEELQ